MAKPTATKPPRTLTLDDLSQPKGGTQRTGIKAGFVVKQKVTEDAIA